ncbi:helix-turn-helix domain-containing protein [Bacillus nitratireducens]|uniref:helix-turn-helix domain-containing protein n=1 Tax=Bacillus nitratireducens TaxID=2026193 RepID=UPI00089C32DC|nr:helix-turn-helix domain-containing protein [Bacillus nitratireducens]OJD49839.1 AraC family transcriptional regulator [Bacillus nitratireducens]PEB80332.1 AraC family transcriptional regulator [Bacillus cereus]PFH79625.1 AraC family transcriptional regulator [Bacillus cereus]SEA74888.1 YSIRK-targeted surface antigen transcriptional regulator [Bacillus nitratireducens]
MEIVILDLQYICELIYEAHQIPVYYVNQFGEIEYEFSSRDLQGHSYYNQFKEQISVYTYEENSKDFPIFFSNSNLSFFFVNLKKANRFLGTIILGPTLESEICDENISKILDAFKGNLNKRKLIEYYRSIPIIDNQQFLTISLLVYYLIYHKKLDKTMVTQNNKALTLDMIKLEHPDLELSKGRRNFIFHSNLSYERVLLDYVKKGQINKIKDIFDYSIVGEAELGLLSKRNRLRSEKNLMITGIALVCRAAIEGGLNNETAFTLSDFYIQQLEELRSLKGILKLMEEAIMDFTNRVHQLNVEKYSATITACQHYIYDHLYDDIKLDHLAQLCHLSPNYLSSLFKKEVGTPLSEYIQRQRVDEAKKLLLLTNYSILDISMWLNFNDQSYFIKIFKKYTGLTPRQFRNDHFPDHTTT